MRASALISGIGLALGVIGTIHHNPEVATFGIVAFFGGLFLEIRRAGDEERRD